MINNFTNTAQKWLKVFGATATISASLGMINSYRGKSAEKLRIAEKIISPIKKAQCRQSNQT